jgi:hypothetical protein
MGDKLRTCSACGLKEEHSPDLFYKAKTVRYCVLCQRIQVARWELRGLTVEQLERRIRRGERMSAMAREELARREGR